MNLMRRFLFLALGLGMLLPAAANAESYWLIMSAGDARAASKGSSKRFIYLPSMHI